MTGRKYINCKLYVYLVIIYKRIVIILILHIEMIQVNYFKLINILRSILVNLWNSVFWVIWLTFSLIVRNSGSRFKGFSDCLFIVKKQEWKENHDFKKLVYFGLNLVLCFFLLNYYWLSTKNFTDLTNVFCFSLIKTLQFNVL